MDQGSGILTPVRLWRERLSLRLVTAVLVLSLLGAVLRTGYDFRNSAQTLEAQIESMGNTIANAVAFSCQDAIINIDCTAMEEYAEYLLNQPDVMIAFVRIERADGKVMNLKNAPSLERVAKTEARMFTAPVRLMPENRVLGRCTIWLDVEPWRDELRSRSTSALLLNFVAFSLLGIVLTMLLRSWLGRPLSEVDAAVQRIATGDLEAKVAVTGVGELRRFACTLESMRENLRDSHVSLAAQNSRLRELDRLKDEFIANMSHEIRTPLSSILGSIELLGTTAPAERPELLDAMQRNGTHLLFLINQVLDFSKLQAGGLCLEARDIAVRDVVEDVLGCLRPQAREKHLDVTLAWAADAPQHVSSDLLRLRQMLMNLVGNAIKFTSHGSVRLAATRVASAHGDRLQIAVVDSGPGIAEHVQRRLFVPFAQGDSSMTRQHGGSGLGLVISRQLARALGGDITLRSTVGVGTEVTLTLPIGPVAAVAAEPAPAAGASPVRADAAPPAVCTGRVLLVDDAADNRRLLSAMLRKTGVDVATAENGETGCQTIAAAAAGGQPFDLVLMDIQMPVLDGHEAARRLRREGHKLPLVALTAHATENDRDVCMQAGFDAYATKPISRAQLVEIVQRWVHRERA